MCSLHGHLFVYPCWKNRLNLNRFLLCSPIEFLGESPHINLLCHADAYLGYVDPKRIPHTPSYSMDASCCNSPDQKAPEFFRTLKLASAKLDQASVRMLFLSPTRSPLSMIIGWFLCAPASRLSDPHPICPRTASTQPSYQLPLPDALRSSISLAFPHLLAT